ncbi:MAG: sigma-70 family RNA polymerase sigma factor [Terracidiphilus sp.]
MSKIIEYVGHSAWKPVSVFRALRGSIGFSAALFSRWSEWPQPEIGLLSSADLVDAKFASVAVKWEDSDMQADLTMGNLASALTFESEEAALIAELQAGSEEAFAGLIARYHQPIYSLLARAVQDRADAADLTQDVFVKIFRGVGSFHGESSLRTWIYRIALREASNHRRWWMRHRQQEIPIDQEIVGNESRQPMRLKEMLADPAESPYDMALHEENRARVEAALSQVPEPFRTTLILRDIEGFVYEEVAEIEGVSLGTVKSRLVRGRAALKEILTVPAQSDCSPERAEFDLPLREEAQ